MALVYGATGYMGGLATRAAIDRGLRPVIVGRSESRVASLAGQLGLEYRVAELTDQAALDRSLQGARVLLNAAGPFSATWRPLVDACLRTGVHYVDLTGEVAVFEGIRTRGRDARQRGIVLLPGAGFDVVPSDCLALHVSGQLPGACTLRLGISGLELLSRGSARTLVELVGQSACVRRQGQLTPIPVGSLERSFDFGAGPAPSIAVSWGDLASAFTTTGIANIETYFEASPMVRALASAHRFLGPLLAMQPWQGVLQSLTSQLQDGPGATERSIRSAVIVAEVEDASGRTARARLRTPEAYSFSALTAADIIAEVLAGNYEPGYQTPASLYGPDYVLRFAGVAREDLAS
jgi:short subunit dehydrogenase-like uncharacterized protein